MIAKTAGMNATRMAKPPLKWITMLMWQECVNLSTQVAAFGGLCNHISTNPQFWLDFAKSDDPYLYLESHEKVGKSCKC